MKNGDTVLGCLAKSMAYIHGKKLQGSFLFVKEDHKLQEGISPYK